MNREEQKQTIKDYLKRLGAGEELESVRVDFVKKISVGRRGRDHECRAGTYQRGNTDQ